MKHTPDRDNLHKIVVLNPKGGSGKTTLATNLASFFSRRGPPPTLVDCDPQGYSIRWLEKRSRDRPKIHGIAAYKQSTPSARDPTAQVWPDSGEFIVDMPAGVPPEQLFDETYDAHSILIPVLPSAIDVHSASRFIAELLLVAQIDRRDRRLAVVANRTRQNTRSYQMLMRFLSSLRIPLIANLRDSQNYVHAAAEGIGIYEMPRYRVRQDIERMDTIIEWLDQWRMRKLDASVSASFEHMPGAEVLTPALMKQ
jgi:chromosome partitioning protein